MVSYEIKIKKLEIKNFRKFNHFSINFDDKFFSVIAGRNATGKTTVLEAVNIAFSERGPKFSDIKESDFNNDEPIVINVEFSLPFFFEFFDESHNYTGLVPCYGFSKTIKRRVRKEQNKFFPQNMILKLNTK